MYSVFARRRLDFYFLRTSQIVESMITRSAADTGVNINPQYIHLSSIHTGVSFQKYRVASDWWPLVNSVKTFILHKNSKDGLGLARRQHY